jgi:hypothetical protein
MKGSLDIGRSSFGYWKIIIRGKESLNPETRVAQLYSGMFHNVSIGKNEAYNPKYPPV